MVEVRVGEKERPLARGEGMVEEIGDGDNLGGVGWLVWRVERMWLGMKWARSGQGSRYLWEG